MEKTVLARPDRRSKSYVRGDYSRDTVYTFWIYKNMGMQFAKTLETVTRVEDRFAAGLVKAGLCTPEQYSVYADKLCRRYPHKDHHPEEAPEDIYAAACGYRAEVFGAEALTAARQLLYEAPLAFDPSEGIDQRREKELLLKNKKAAIFLLTQPELCSRMLEDLDAAFASGCRCYVCASPTAAGDVPSKEQLSGWLRPRQVTWLEAKKDALSCDADLQKAVDEGEACLLFYGEEGLLHCRSLLTDAVVTCRPMGYHAQALCNQLGAPRDNVVYIPAGLDITPWVRLDAKTRLSYAHLARLSKVYGRGIYEMTPQALYSAYGKEFVNIYDNGPNRLPLEVSGSSLEEFDRQREQAVARWLGAFPGVGYTCAYFDEQLSLQPVSYAPEERLPGILVHSIRVRRSQGARVLACPKGVTPRQLLSGMALPETALISNFLFFLTPKLGNLYNDLRADRPLEQADAAAGHLDYMLCHTPQGRVETFPLFAKSCVAMTRQGSFRFFDFRLGGGSVTIGNSTVTWEKADVDPEVPGDVCIYTPFLSARDEEADRQTYRKLVGKDRVNFVILRDRVTCIRRGDVVLPSVGVVLSLTEEAARSLLSGCRALENGYYDPAGLSLTVQLAPPETVDPETWSQLAWVYGGGMSLIREGEGLCDGENMEAWFQTAGWMTPLSRQTQESALHKLAKHPRTAMGTTSDGDLVILVYSGRTKMSSGADYREMIAIARRLYPDIQNLMNVDGGGSAVLGLCHRGSFMELSYPATSSGSCAGQVRPIHTLFYIPIG